MVVKGPKRKGEETLVVPGSKKNSGTNHGSSTTIKIPSPRPSPNPLSRPRAQRKFAQGVSIDSPPVTPLKVKPTTSVDRKPVPVPPPISPPTKRPKTEDFLNFLCYRGTSALPKKLNFFNYPPAYERGLGAPSDELKSWKLPNSTAKSTASSNSAINSATQSVPQRSRPDSTDTKSKETGKATPTKCIPKKKSSDTNQKAGKEKLVKSNIKKSTEPVPLPKTRATHINEIEAKFALSALKLKYQEKRLAKPVLTTVNKLAKKVKDRRVILTRSKSKDDENEKPSSSKVKAKKKVKQKPSTQVARRNAPSPDIIDGLSLRQKKLSAEHSSSSESSSTSSDDEDSSTSSDDSSEDEDKTVTRSLRSGGKSFVMSAKKKVKTVRKKVPSPRCISTRASRRNSTSPLRELPMYGVLKKRKKLKKIKAAIKKKIAASPRKKDKEKVTYCDVTGRPTRKTKEYASIFFGLLSKEFSSDENDISGKSNAEDSSGDTSSSETKFLETQYKAILKRDEQKEQDKRKRGSKSEMKKHSSRIKRIPITKKMVFKKPMGKKFKIPEKRILRSQSNRDESPRKASSSGARVMRRRITVPISPCDKPVHAGAARKSASIVPRKNSKRSTSSSSTSSSSASSSSSDSESEETDEPKAKKEKIAPLPPRRRTMSRTKETSSRDSHERDSETDKSDSIKKPLPVRQRSFSTSANETAIQTEVSQPLAQIPETVETSSCSSTSEDSESDSSSSEDERVVEKVEIAIQVDMDLEDNMENMDDNMDDVQILDEIFRQEERIPTPQYPQHQQQHQQQHQHQHQQHQQQQHQQQHQQQQQPSFSNSMGHGNFNPPMSMSMPMPAPPPMSMPMQMPHSMPMPIPMSMTHQLPIQIPMPPQQQPQHHQHQPQPSFIPFPGPSFYPTLSNVEFVSQQRTQQEFSLMLPTLSLPNAAGVPTYNFAPSNVLTQNSLPLPMCFSSTSISAATTLQTHIRSVAANLDIPLVRPVVTPNTNLNLPLIRPAVTTQSNSNPNRPLTRPIMNVWSENRNPLPNYSAFRVPISTGTTSGYTTQRLLAPGPIPISTSQQQQQQQQQYSMISNHNQNQYMMANVLSNSNNTAMGSNAGHSVQSRNIPQVSRPVAPMNTITSSGVPGLSAHGLSLIQSLPNVSIVPKFDRNTKTIIVPPDHKPSSSTSVVATAVPPKSNVKKKPKDTPPKEKGRKRKSLSFPEPTSPLAVRKDSSTPATYVGVSSKKAQKVSKEQGASTSTFKEATGNPFSKLLEFNKPDSEGVKDKSAYLPTRSPSAIINPAQPMQFVTDSVDSGKIDRPKKSDSSGLKNYSGTSKSGSTDLEKTSRPHKSESSGLKRPKKSESADSAKVGRPKKSESADSNKPGRPKKSDSADSNKPPRPKKSDSADSNKPGRPKKSDSADSNKPARPKKSESADSNKPPRPKKSESADSNKPAKPKKSASVDTDKPVRSYKKSDAGSKEKSPHQSKKVSAEKPPYQSTHSETEIPRPDSADRLKPPESDEKGVKIEDVPAFYPTDEEFQDPLKYISQIQVQAEKYGMARIVPPRSFRPECNVEDDMRFTAYNHYIHRMFKRWGPNVQERVAMMEHLRQSKVDVSTSTPPMIGGMEIDLTTMYHTVQSMGGLTEVIQKDKWNKVSDAMHIPKAANDRAGKLDAVYVKYVLPYEMLSEPERKKLLNEVDKKWKLREKRDAEESDSESEEDNPLEEVEDSIIKGKSTPLSAYYRVARNTLSMIFKNKEPSWSEVELSYWKLVRDRDLHFCVYSGSIDCAGLGWGFPLPKPGTKHPWNLKVLANSQGSVLRSMGPVMGATVPTLHVGMVYTTYCWYRDPHGLSWVEYLHSGGNKIWYAVPASHQDLFHEVLKELMPRQCRNKKIWLASDSAMVPPELLQARGVPMFRVVQNPGEFLVVFPGAFTSAICTGYVISESVCFALPKWLHTAVKTFQDIRESKEPPVFALEKLVMNILSDPRVSVEVLNLVLPLAKRLIAEEIGLRKKLRELGVGTGKMTSPNEKVSKKNKKKEENELHECDTCNYILHLSLVNNKVQELVYCLPHAIQYLAKNKTRIKASLLLFDQTDEQLRSVLEAAQSRLK